jgi:hypothetical protein
MPSDTRVNPASTNPAKNAGDVDSGLASVVTSAPSASPNVDRIAPSTTPSRSAPISDGVPPPTNTVSTGRGPTVDAASASSRRTASSHPSGEAPEPASSDAV